VNVRELPEGTGWLGLWTLVSIYNWVQVSLNSASPHNVDNWFWAITGSVFGGFMLVVVLLRMRDARRGVSNAD
jgi:hypothetical protein